MSWWMICSCSSEPPGQQSLKSLTAEDPQPQLHYHKSINMKLCFKRKTTRKKQKQGFFPSDTTLGPRLWFWCFCFLLNGNFCWKTVQILMRNFRWFFNPLENKKKKPKQTNKQTYKKLFFFVVALITYKSCFVQQDNQSGLKENELGGAPATVSPEPIRNREKPSGPSFFFYSPAVIGRIYLQLPVSCHSERSLCAEAPPPPLLRHECEISEIYDLSGGFSLHPFTSNTSVPLSKRRESWFIDSLIHYLLRVISDNTELQMKGSLTAEFWLCWRASRRPWPWFSTSQIIGDWLIDESDLAPPPSLLHCLTKHWNTATSSAGGLSRRRAS